MFSPGDRVRKVKGYTYEGVVVAIFRKLDGQTRLVVEVDGEACNGLLHIFSPEQMELLTQSK
jgi:hypothetical protein